MKKKILLISAAVIALAAVCVIGYTLAYFTATDKAENEFTIGNIDLLLREPKWDGYDFDDDLTDPEGGSYVPTDNVLLGKDEADPTMPGDTIYKNPMVKNTGDNDFYVRLLVTIDNYAAFNAIEGYNLVSDLFDNSFATDWALEGDGLGKDNGDDTVTYEFRYVGTTAGILAKGEKTSALFDHIKIPTSIDKEFKDIANVSITVVAQAIQAENFNDAAAAFAALEAQLNP